MWNSACSQTRLPRSDSLRWTYRRSCPLMDPQAARHRQPKFQTNQDQRAGTSDSCTDQRHAPCWSPQNPLGSRSHPNPERCCRSRKSYLAAGSLAMRSRQELDAKSAWACGDNLDAGMIFLEIVRRIRPGRDKGPRRVATKVPQRAVRLHQHQVAVRWIGGLIRIEDRHSQVAQIADHVPPALGTRSEAAAPTWLRSPW